MTASTQTSTRARAFAQSIPRSPVSDLTSARTIRPVRSIRDASEQNSTSDQPVTKMLAKPLRSSLLADPMLALVADIVDDLERTRIANENRLRQLTCDEDDSDGLNRGHGLTIDNPVVKSVTGLVESLAAMEHQAVLTLRRSLRAHPLGPWVKSTDGVGEKQGARLLAAIGDPYWNTLYDRPRTVSELWAYCGYHVLRTGHASGETQSTAAGANKLPAGGDNPSSPDTQSGSGVAASRIKGQRSNWSANAKTRAYLIAESCMKCRQSPYRKVYDDTRVKYAEATHEVACRRCGPAGNPALVGSGLSEGHKHARALRAVAKEVLRDLWIQSKAIHEGSA